MNDSSDASSEKESILEGVSSIFRNTYNKGEEAPTNDLDPTLENGSQPGGNMQQKQDTPIIDSDAGNDTGGDSDDSGSTSPIHTESKAAKHNVEKERRYVDSVDEIPEGYEAQTGERGGTYWTPDSNESTDDDSDDGESEWGTVTDDMGYGDFDGKQILVDGEMYNASVYMSGDEPLVTVEEDLTGDEPGYTTDGGMFEGFDTSAIDGIREGPEEEEPDPEPEPEPEEEESIDPDEWNDPPEDFNDLESGQKILINDEDLGGYRTATLSDTIYIGDDYTLISVSLDDGEVHDIRDTGVIEGVGDPIGDRPNPAESTTQEIIDWLPFRADNERKEEWIRGYLQNAADSTVSEEVSKTVLDHIKAIESMPGRSHIVLTAGTSQERPALNLGTGARRGTVNHEYAHMVADAYGYSVDREAIRRSMMQYDSEKDTFIEANPNDERFHLTQVEGKQPPTEVRELMDAINDGWSRIQENSEEADEYTIRDNYAAINAHELLAATNETLQRTFGSKQTVETLYEKHPDILETYTKVFNPSNENKQEIADYHKSNPSDSLFEMNPYPDHVSKDLAENERRKGFVKVADLQTPTEIREGTMQKVAENFEKVDDLLMEAVEKQIWKDIEDIEKAPNMWRLGDNVPQFVRSYVKQAASQSGVMYYDYSGIPHLAGLEVQKIITDSLTESDGWSIDSISKRLIDKFEGLERKQSVTIVRTEVGAVLNKAREMAYKANEADPDVYWTGPDDSHTTKLCTETKQEIESRGGHVKMSVLKEILMEKAKKYADDGGTPGRVDSFLCHYNCRHTFVRAEYRFLNP